MALADIGTNVRRYMNLKGFSIPRLAEASGLGSATLSNLLNGKGNPSTKTLFTISSALGVSVAELISEPPRLTDFRFRTKKALTAREKAAKEQLLISCAKWLSDYKFLEEVTGTLPRENKFKGVDYSAMDAEEAASCARGILNLSQDEPVNDIMSSIEAAGIKIRVVPFGLKQTFGVSAGSSDGGPAVFINASSDISAERQIFTAGHELGHLLMHQNSYSNEPGVENDEEEKAADIFASFLLMPRKAFEEKWNEYRGYSWVDTVLLMKHYFKVSYQTVIRRYSMVHDKDYSELIRTFCTLYKARYGHDLSNHFEPNAIVTKPVINREDNFSSLVRCALEKGEISSSRAAEMLGLNIYEMRDLVKEWQI